MHPAHAGTQGEECGNCDAHLRHPVAARLSRSVLLSGIRRVVVHHRHLHYPLLRQQRGRRLHGVRGPKHHLGSNPPLRLRLVRMVLRHGGRGLFRRRSWRGRSRLARAHLHPDHDYNWRGWRP